MRASKNRCFHLAMVRELSLKLEYKSPAANRKMMRARRAKSARPRPVRARDSRALRSSPVSTMSAVVCGMRHTNIYMSLVQATSACLDPRVERVLFVQCGVVVDLDGDVLLRGVSA